MSGRKVLSLFIAACAAAALAAQASSPGRCGAARVDGAAIATVHVVSACHLDVGFRYMAPQIVNLWWHTHFPDVIKVAAELEARNQSAAAVSRNCALRAPERRAGLIVDSRRRPIDSRSSSSPPSRGWCGST